MALLSTTLPIRAQYGDKNSFGGAFIMRFQQSYLVNPNLKWETVNAAEVGLELDALDNRLHVEAAYFNRETKDLMTYISRGSIGLLDELINGGSLRKLGQEISVV